MDYSDDSVQWLGSQAACPALDNLLSEATFKPHPELFRTPRDFPSRRRSSRYTASKASSSTQQFPSPASTSTSSSPFAFATASDSGRRGTVGSIPSNSYALDDHVGTSSWQASSNDYRNRQSRSSNSANGETISAPDCDRFFNLLEKASARINDSIRHDTNTSRDVHRRKPPPSKSTASARNAQVKRVKRDVHSGIGLGAASEGITKGKARDFATMTDDPMNIPGRSARITKSFSLQQDHVDRMVDVDPPRPSPEVMPPPPVPPLLNKNSMLSHTQVTHQSDLPLFPSKPSIPPPSVSLEPTPTMPSLGFESQYEPITQTQNACPASSNVAPGPMPKLHPLLDPERRQRRLMLERTISASLASLSSGSSSDFGSPPHTTIPTAGHSSAPPARIHTSHQTRTLPLSQDGASTRPPPLGMRRTNTFPLPSQNSSDTSNRNLRVAKPAKKNFKLPLLSSTQSPPTDSSSRSNHPSSHLSSSSLKPLHETSHCKDAPKPIDEEMDEDLSSNSDADFSFGETVKFDIDMDALEETMRKYD